MSGYRRTFDYGGALAPADEDDTVNGRAPYLLDARPSINTNADERGMQMLVHLHDALTGKRIKKRKA